MVTVRLGARQYSYKERNSLTKHVIQFKYLSYIFWTCKWLLSFWHQQTIVLAGVFYIRRHLVSYISMTRFHNTQSLYFADFKQKSIPSTDGYYACLAYKCLTVRFYGHKNQSYLNKIQTDQAYLMRFYVLCKSRCLLVMGYSRKINFFYRQLHVSIFLYFCCNFQVSG